MSASVTSKKQCVKCDKGGGILICDGCQQSFCGKHVNEHRQELGVELDNIVQEHDSLRQQLEQPSLKKSPLLKKIDKWEKDSIAKIQTAAETARTTLQELLSESKERISKEYLGIATKLRSSREADDYSENDLTRWKEQLKELQKELTSPPPAKLEIDKNKFINVMKLTSNESTNNQSASSNQVPRTTNNQSARSNQVPRTTNNQSARSNQVPRTTNNQWASSNQVSRTTNNQWASSNQVPRTTNSANFDRQERFFQILGPVSLEEGGYLATRTGCREAFAHIRGRYLHATGCYVIRFKIEQSTQPYRIFFGCMSFQGTLNDNAFKSPHAVGWFGSDQVYEHGRCTSNVHKYNYQSTKIVNNDELHLILDCDNRQIRLFHEREKTTYLLSVDDKLAPFPWQYLVVLYHPGDAVRILPNSSMLFVNKNLKTKIS